MLKDEIECKKKNQNKKFSKVKKYIYIYQKNKDKI